MDAARVFFSQSSLENHRSRHFTLHHLQNSPQCCSKHVNDGAQLFKKVSFLTIDSPDNIIYINFTSMYVQYTQSINPLYRFEREYIYK